MMKMMELPPNAFLNVLCRLPLKYLMRLRCVSKFFLDLTNNQNFIFYYRNPPPYLDLLLRDDDFNFMDTTTSSSSLVLASSSSSTSSNNQWQLPWRFHIMFKGSNFIYLQKRHELIPFRGPNNNKRLIGSINGLVCLSGPCSLEIYNISAGTHFNLGYPGCGFGYDPISNDYNILCLDDYAELLYYSFRTNSWKQLDYSLGTNSWKKLDYIVGGGSVCINGIIYWPPGNRQVYDHHHPQDDDDDDNNKKMIVSFDLHKEKFSQIPLPDEDHLLLPIMTNNMQLLSFRGCLAFAFINRRRRKTSKTKTKSRKGEEEIWVELFKLKRRSRNAEEEEENNYSWIRESFVVPIPSTRQKEAEIVSCCDEVFLGWFESKKQLLRLYNLDTKQFFNLPLSPPSQHYPKVSWSKNDITYVDNLRFNF